MAAVKSFSSLSTSTVSSLKLYAKPRDRRKCKPSANSSSTLSLDSLGLNDQNLKVLVALANSPNSTSKAKSLFSLVSS